MTPSRGRGRRSEPIGAGFTWAESGAIGSREAGFPKDRHPSAAGAERAISSHRATVPRDPAQPVSDWAGLETYLLKEATPQAQYRKDFRRVGALLTGTDPAAAIRCRRCRRGRRLGIAHQRLSFSASRRSQAIMLRPGVTTDAPLRRSRGLSLAAPAFPVPLSRRFPPFPRGPGLALSPAQ